MPCGDGCDGLITKLKDLAGSIGNGHDNGSCCSPACAQLCEIPFAQVCFTCPPCIPLPTTPCPVKPLRMPCPPGAPTAQDLITHERTAFNSRYDNFYNNYNGTADDVPDRSGCDMRCEDYAKKPGKPCRFKGCPTGFKPCTMKMRAPPYCNPIGAWTVQVQPCPAKPKKVEKTWELSTAENCRRPCCKHWKPKQGPCLYDDPCKAHCFDHPPGIKPSGRHL